MRRILRSVVVALVMAAMLLPTMAIPALAEPPFFFLPGQTPPPPSNQTAVIIECQREDGTRTFHFASNQVGGGFGDINSGPAHWGSRGKGAECERTLLKESDF